MSIITKKTLITGGAGFIGYHLAERLSNDAGNEIVLVDNLIRGRMDRDFSALLARPNINFINGDLTEPATFASFSDGYDEVYHLAAIIGVKNVLNRPQEVVRVNALSTLLLLDWFVKGGGKRLLFSSTSETYAWTQQFYELPIPTPENVPLALTDLNNPRATYAGSKIFGELAVNQYCKAFNKEYIIVRYHNVYGPRMGHEHVIPELFMRAMAKESPLVVYSANHSRAFCYISDAINCTINLMRSDHTSGETYNIGNSKEEATIAELAKIIIQIANCDTTIQEKIAPNDPIKRRCPDISKVISAINYNPKITLREGVALTTAWYRKESNVIERGV